MQKINARLIGLGISKPYASQIATGARDPSLALAIRIYRELGLKFGPLKGASKSEITTLARLASRSSQTASAA
jgi:hypothetical protein